MSLMLTFDVEIYGPLRSHTRFLSIQSEAWAEVLDVLERAEVRTTFFLTVEFARVFPDLATRMFESNHEVASHSVTHRPYRLLGLSNFENEVFESKKLLERMGAESVIGFRAPYGQVPRSLADVLVRNGYKYDSSIAATHIPGHFESLLSPKHPYIASQTDIRKPSNGGSIMELPISVTPVMPLPYGGIFLSFLSPLLSALPGSRRSPHIMFLHPYDFVDLRPFRESYPWDKVKPTENNWRLLRLFATEMRGGDARLRTLL